MPHHLPRHLEVTVRRTLSCIGNALRSTHLSHQNSPLVPRKVAAISQAVETIRLVGIKTPQTTIQLTIRTTRQPVAIRVAEMSLRTTSAPLARIRLAPAFPTHAPQYQTLEITARALGAQGTALHAPLVEQPVSSILAPAHARRPAGMSTRAQHAQTATTHAKIKLGYLSPGNPL